MTNDQLQAIRGRCEAIEISLTNGPTVFDEKDAMALALAKADLMTLLAHIDEQAGERAETIKGLKEIQEALEKQGVAIDLQTIAVNALKAENAALKEDRVRLDWLATQEDYERAYPDYLKWCVFGEEDDTLREAIDITIEKTAKPKENGAENE